MTTFQIIENVLFFAALYVLLWYGYILLFNRGVPNIKSAPAIRKKIIDLIREDKKRKNKDDYVIVDPGAGNGNFARQIARALPDAHVIAVEISKIAYWRGRLVTALSGVQNLEHRNEDFHHSDALEKADAVVMFLVCSLMKSIREIMETKTSKDTLVISNKFPVGGSWEPEKDMEVETLNPHQKRVLVYYR